MAIQVAARPAGLVAPGSRALQRPAGSVSSQPGQGLPVRSGRRLYAAPCASSSSSGAQRRAECWSGTAAPASGWRQRQCTEVRLEPSRRSVLARSTPVAASSSGAADHHHDGSAAAERALHPAALKCLVTLYFCACFVERTWRFGLPLVLAFVGGGLQAITILGFVAPLAGSLLGPAMGRILDNVYRPLGLGAMLVLQNLAILLSALALVAAAAPGGAPLVSSPLFGLLVVLTMLEKVTSMSSETAIERDWVTQLAGKHNAGALALSNASLRRIDLVAELLGTLAFNWVYSRGLPASMAFAAGLAALAIPLQLLFIGRIMGLAPAAMLHGRHEPGAAWARLPDWRSFVETARLRRVHAAEAAARRRPLAVRAREQLAHALDGWRSYFAQPILPSSLSFVLLSFNVILMPGGLIFALLTLWGFDGNAVSIFKGGCATCGFLGTLLAKRLIARLGLLRTGIIALTIQSALLISAAAIYTTCLSGPPALGPGGGGWGLASGWGLADGGSWPLLAGLPLPAVLFAALVVASRIGVWAFDMVNSQLFQQTVPARQIASTSSAEVALCNFSELVMLGVAAARADPASFPPLVYASCAAVAAAALLFRAWARRAQPSLDLAMASMEAA